MQIDIITLFPDMFQGPFSKSIIKKAQEKGLVQINIHNLRKWTKDKHQTVDDKPFGGGPGMLLMCEPIFNCIKSLINQKSKILSSQNVNKNPRPRRVSLPAGEAGLGLKNDNIKFKNRNAKSHAIYLTPQGRIFNQEKALELSGKEHLILLCGHYEGIDQRVINELVDEEISIGDYVLTGGEIPAMVVVDAVVRLIPGVLEGEGATEEDSFSGGNRLLEYPQYTRPANFRGLKIPEVLLSGDHEKIKKWREAQRLKVTRAKRKDLVN